MAALAGAALAGPMPDDSVAMEERRGAWRLSCYLYATLEVSTRPTVSLLWILLSYPFPSSRKPNAHSSLATIRYDQSKIVFVCRTVGRRSNKE